jgi:hypothetical protein
VKTAREYLAELRVLARKRGGRVLSDRYIDDGTKLRFRCAAEHEWEASPGKIKQGRWCPECGKGRSAMAKKCAAYARLRLVVQSHGGAIVTPEYVSSQTKMRFRCAAGHEWEAVPNSILQGMWCRRCAITRNQERRRQGVFLRIREVAARHGNELLAHGFVSSHTPMLMRCARGHELRRLAATIEGNARCPQCREEDWLAEIRRRAAEHGGACLSKRVRDAAARVRLVCARGHRFESTATRVKAGHWCPRCRQAIRHDLARMREVARERGGECLSRRYVDSSKLMRWRCAEGHEWRAKAQSIVQGSWCRICRRGQGKSRRRLSIEIMRQLALERGGVCLSERYTGIYDDLRWRCAQGHEWVTKAINVRRGGWCPSCSYSVLGTLERMRALAVERGGRCLTTKWNDHQQALHFECGRGHRFRLRSNIVKSGVWCPICPRVRGA